MASDSEKRRGKRDDEAAGRGRRAKRPRLDEERTSSERELALHASDEDIFSLGALVSKGKRILTSGYVCVREKCLNVSVWWYSN